MNIHRCTCGGAATVQRDGTVWCAGTFRVANCGRREPSVAAWNHDREERAAIMEFDAGLSRAEAERRAGL